MYAKIKTILLPVLLALAIVSLLTVSLTLGRYTEEKGSEGQYSGDLEYIVSNQVEINKVDEFFSAIENGYSNIKIADDVDNPLIISGGISDVNSDLVIDLNGHEIQRNNREPLLNVTQGVRLTIIDTSKEQTGSFYNPVGSVLQISGGTLTVSAGVFESGPRSGEEGAALSEYYGSGENGKDTQQGARIDASRTDVTFFESDTDTGTAGRMPVIYPSVVTSSAGENAKRSANGNIYFGTDYGAAGLTRPVSADTYLYFTVDDPTVEKSTLAAPGSADYFYTYYLDKSLTVYRGTDASEADDILITVYVYNDVKGSAQSSDFSAIGMKKGNLYVRGGTYRSYFGEENTYCVDASGGYMAIESGSFYAYGSGVCVQCAYENVDTEKEYLRVSNGTFYSEIGNTIGVSGGRMVVSAASFTKNALGSTKTAAQNANGSAIYVSGGSLSVSASSTIRFSLYGAAMNGISAASGAVVNVKNVEMDFYSDSLNSTLPGSTSYNFGIYSSGGSVTCDGTTAFYVIGSHSSGIYSNGGTINIDGDSFTCSVAMDDGDKILSSTAISAVGGDINFNVAQADIRSNGLGITVGGGNIQFAHSTKETINITTTRGTAIFAYGGKVSVDRNSTLSVKSTIADGCVWAEDTSGGTSGGTDTGVNVNNGIYLLGGSFDSKGSLEITHTGVPNAAGSDSKIRSYAVRVDGGDLSGGSGTMSSFAAKNLTIQVMDHGGGLYVNGGSITLGEENSAEGDEAVITAQGYGIAMRGAEGDSVTVYGTLTLTSEHTTGIYITGGSLLLHKTANVTSVIDPNYVFCPANDSNRAIDSYDGIFIENGTLTAAGDLTVDFTGVSNTAALKGTNLINSMIRSYAVRVDGSALAGSASFKAENLQINADGYKEGGGVYVNQGRIILHTATIRAKGYGIALRGASATDSVTVNGALDLQSARTTGIYITGGSLTLNGEANIISSIDAAYTFVSGAPGTVSYDGVFVEGGSLTADTSAFNVTHTGVANDDVGSGDNADIDSSTSWFFVRYSENAYLDFAIKSFGVRIEGGTNTQVSISSGEITNSSGGGIYVSGGNVTLNCDVTASGTEMFSTWYRIPDAAENWSAPMPRTGGHAVQVDGGTLTIDGGSYQASRGNGILVRSGSATVRGGVFYGNDPTDGAEIAGAAASYGFKMYGGTVEIDGGTFGGNGSGAFVMGTSQSEKGTAKIHGGSFSVTGQAGFSVYKYGDVTFGEVGVSGSILVKGNAAGLVIESTPEGAPTVTIHSGTYDSLRNSNGDGIWNGNGSAVLTITGGTFTGSSRSGLRLDVGTSTPPVQISGGTFYGNGSYSAITANTSLYVRNIIPQANVYDGSNQISINSYTSLSDRNFAGSVRYTLVVRG